MHTLALTTKTPYMITAGPVYNALTLPGGIADLTGTSLPYGWAGINGRIYFSNGSRVGLYSNGENAVYSSTHPGAWRYCGVLANHLITCNTTEAAPGLAGSTNYPQRVRWSSVGDPNNWTVGASSTAGFQDLLEVPDQITGYASLGRSGYIFRTNGITLVTPTGVGTAPFQFDQVTNSPQGVGCKYAYTLATYGAISVFVSTQDVYVFDGTTFTPIGGEAKKKIYADIANASGDQIWAGVVPRLGPQFDYLSYWLTIPGVNVSWVYSLDDQAWQRFSSSNGYLTALASVTV